MARPKAGYTTVDGVPVPGVTTIVGLLDKPALVGWAGKTMHAAALEYGRECWSAGRTQQQAPALPRWTQILYGKRDKAAEDGTAAHALLERHLNGEDVQRDGASDGAWQAYENALHWLDASGLEVEAFEQPMVSEVYSFGGTPDAIAKSNGKTYLADWKTGGVYESHAIQMAAYAVLLKECHGIEVEGVHLVRFSRDFGDFTHHFWDRSILTIGWRVFSSLLKIHDPLYELKARCK